MTTPKPRLRNVTGIACSHFEFVCQGVPAVPNSFPASYLPTTGKPSIAC